MNSTDTPQTSGEPKPVVIGSRSVGSSLARIVAKRSSLATVSQITIANLLIQATNMACGFVSARALGPTGRGELTAILVWPQFLAYLLTLGVPVASIYHTKRQPSLASSFSAVALLTSLIMGIVGAVLGLAVIPLSLHSYSPHIIRVARLLVLACPVSLVGLVVSIQTQTAESFRLYNLFRVLPPMLILTGLLIALKLGFLSPAVGALVYVAAGFPIFAWNLVWVWRHFRPSFRRLRYPASLLFGYGLKVWGSDLLSTISNQVDRMMVIGILTAADLGLYTVAQSAVALLNIIPGAVLAVILPKTSDRSHAEIAASVARAARFTAACMFAAGLPLCIAGEFALRLVYGPKFAGAAIVLRILVLEGVLDGTVAVLTQAFLAAGFPGTVTILQLLGLAAALPLLAILGPKWGLNGAAAAMLISTSLRLLFVSFSFGRRLGVGMPRLILSWSDIALVLRDRQLHSGA